MQEQECTLDLNTIEAAVAGEKWALEKVLAYYADYIEELATVEVEQPDGSVKKVTNGNSRSFCNSVYQVRRRYSQRSHPYTC